MHSGDKKHVTFVVVGMLCALAWGVFLTHLDTESLWYDEWFSWTYSTRAPLDMVRETAIDVHPPGYYLYLWGWIQLTGSDNLFVMRVSAAIPAVLVVALCYRIALAWFRRQWVGGIAAAFMATSGVFIYYARELRMYTLVVLLVMISWWLLHRWLNGRRWGLVSYSASVALMLYTYYFTAFMVLIQALVVLIYYRHHLPRLLTGYAAAFIAFLPWLPTVYDQLVLENLRSGKGGELALGSMGKVAAAQVTSLETIAAFLERYSAGQTTFLVGLILLALVLGLSRQNALSYRRYVVVALLWFVGTVGLFWIVNPFVSVYNERYVLRVLPGAALLVGVCVDQLPARARPGLLALIVVSGLLTHTSAFLEPKVPHNNMLAAIAGLYQSGDRIWYNLNSGARGSSLEFEAGYALKSVAPQIPTDDFVWNAPRDFADQDAVPRLWDVRPYWIEPSETTMAEILDGRVETEKILFEPYTIRLYEAPPREDLPAQFGDLFALQVTPLHPTIYHPGDRVTLKTWWSALRPPELDYSYGLYMRDKAGVVMTQIDAGLAPNELPSSGWSPDALPGLQKIEITLPDKLPPGDYDLWLSIYYWENPSPLPVVAPEAYPVDSSANIIRLAEINVTSA